MPSLLVDQFIAALQAELLSRLYLMLALAAFQAHARSAIRAELACRIYLFAAIAARHSANRMAALRTVNGVLGIVRPAFGTSIIRISAMQAELSARGKRLAARIAGNFRSLRGSSRSRCNVHLIGQTRHLVSDGPSNSEPHA
jgi:hypothetical protein